LTRDPLQSKYERVMAGLLLESNLTAKKSIQHDAASRYTTTRKWRNLISHFGDGLCCYGNSVSSSLIGGHVTCVPERLLDMVGPLCS